MNYRHVYHAGNFADVLKHAVLALVIEHLKSKGTPFRVIDTHAGVGSYDLSSTEAQKTGEWLDGIGRLTGATLPPGIADILRPYLMAVSRENIGSGGAILRYPGSPQIARSLLRPVDILAVNELHPDDCVRLTRLFAGDPQTKVLKLNGWDAIKALLPPKERRGVTLIDPPFEELGEFDRLVQGLRDAHKRFATGTVIAWYPIKDERAVAAFHAGLQRLEMSKLMSVVLMVRNPSHLGGLPGTGLVISNPPFTLESKLQVLLPYLKETLQQGSGARSHIEWLKREAAPIQDT
ncbi:MAG: 23S rRNA (adenine(2030)-N(6))-methyltransferase RlmJ [Hyphomicrobium sp.]